MLGGSSPLARGTADHDLEELQKKRFIPAGAGNRAQTTDKPGGHAVHPRWRGEQVRFAPVAADHHGSSPLARGTVYVADMRAVVFRFIPAGAGNRVDDGPHAKTDTVHPRWRGEQRQRNGALAPSHGSSPLARGTGADPQVNGVPTRFIPAGAGNSGADPAVQVKVAVHPRWRGEQNAPQLRWYVAVGSSPLARGTVIPDLIGVSIQRFIPAGAGNRADCVSPALAKPVHPRWRGEQSPKPLAGLDFPGSSPLARGTAFGWLYDHVEVRFIPAGAGNSLTTTSTPIRSCGSSPLARGTAEFWQLIALKPRFIPAGAGNRT